MGSKLLRELASEIIARSENDFWIPRRIVLPVPSNIVDIAAGDFHIILLSGTY